MDSINIVASSQARRADSYIASQVDLSRSSITKLIEEGQVTINGNVIVPKTAVKEGDIIVINRPQPIELSLQPQDIELDIVYQDSQVAVINKPQGMIVHPSGSIVTGTLVNAILYHIRDLSGINGVMRPGIVHRLDKDTSGLIVVAKTDLAHNAIASQLVDKTCSREYVAVVEGVVKNDSGTIDKPIGRSEKNRKLMAIDPKGRSAITDYTVLERYPANSLVQFNLRTGRTHQIRVHSKYKGHPIVGDKQYGYKNQRFALGGQLLHARKLSFNHPTTGERVTFESPLPDYFVRVVDILRKMS